MGGVGVWFLEASQRETVWDILVGESPARNRVEEGLLLNLADFGRRSSGGNTTLLP